jgi:ankyrin repeat protein
LIGLACGFVLFAFEGTGTPDLQVLSALLEAGADIKLAGNYGNSVLHAGVHAGHPIALSRDVRQKSRALCGMASVVPCRTAQPLAAALWVTPWSRCLVHGSCVRVLALTRPRPAVPWRVRSAAASGGHTNCVQLLLEYGSSVNSKNKNGCVPSQVALRDDVRALSYRHRPF